MNSGPFFVHTHQIIHATIECRDKKSDLKDSTIAIYILFLVVCAHAF